jgi:hypothetical protein
MFFLLAVIMLLAFVCIPGAAELLQERLGGPFHVKCSVFEARPP